jgi:hypothetical protein
MDTTSKLTQRLRKAFNVLDRSGAVEISPSSLASTVLQELDPRNLSPELVRTATLLELRQLARAFCRKRQSESESSAERAASRKSVRRTARLTRRPQIKSGDSTFD